MHGGDAVPFKIAVEDVPDGISRRLIGPHVPRIREFRNQHPEVRIVGARMSLDFYEKNKIYTNRIGLDALWEYR